MTSQTFTHIRQENDGTNTEREIRVYRVEADCLKVDLAEDIEIGDIIEDRVGGRVKRMQILDVIPHRFGGPLSGFNDHLELRFEVRSRAEITPPKHYEVSSLHPVVAEIARERLPVGKGNDAVFRAFEAIETRIQSLTKQTEIGDKLMTAVFRNKPDASLLDIADSALEPHRQEFERNGYRFIFMGVASGIRNTHAHGSRPEISPAETFELLALASHLMRRLDLAESRLPS
jgi:uncharacterized protein (TIGR02391 family)